MATFYGPYCYPTDNAYMNAYSNRPMVDCFKKTNLVTFSNQNKIELICSDDDPINILVRLNFNLWHFRGNLAYCSSGPLFSLVSLEPFLIS